MKKSWGVTIKAEHEYYYDPSPDKSEDTCNLSAVAVNTIKVERQVDGDDEACDALWASQVAFNELKQQYGISAQLHIISIKVKEVL